MGARRWALRLRLVAGALGSLLAILVLASPASAHATLLSSDPANGSVLADAPSQVRLSFDEGVSVQPAGVDVYGPGGAVVRATAEAQDRDVVVTFQGTLVRGTYVVSWHVASDDGHPESGVIIFSVGAPSAEPPQLPAELRSSHAGPLGLLQVAMYLGLMLTVGLIWFGDWILPDRAALERLPDLVLAVGAIAVFATVAWVPTTVAYQAGAPASVGWQLTLGSWGSHPAELTSLGLIVGGVAVAVLAFLRHRPRVAAVAGLLAASGPAAFGHSRTADPVWLAIPADVAHVAAGAAWLGGMVGLLLAWRGLEPSARLGTVQRFSTVATASLATVVLTGSFAAWRILGSWDAWLHTDYGRLLSLKLALVAGVIALAARTRRRLRAASPRTIACEAVLLVAVVGVTSFLTDADPVPAPARAPAGVQTVRVGTWRAALQLDPARVGRNVVVVTLRDAAGRPADPAAPPVVSLSGPELDLGDVPIDRSATGRYRAVVQLTDPGRWVVRLRLRLPSGERAVGRAAFLALDPAPAASVPSR